MGQTVLLVTWFYLAQPPVVSQTVFENERACGLAKMAVLSEAGRLKTEAEKRLPQSGGFGTIQAAVPPYPTVSVTCSPLK